MVSVAGLLLALPPAAFSRGFLTTAGCGAPLTPLALWFTSPVTQKDIAWFAQRRRERRLREHFRPAARISQPDPAFKSGLDPDGSEYPADIDLSDFPSYAAMLLKWKKHEWIVYGFASSRTVKAMWAHKGPDKWSVYVLPPEELERLARRYSADTVLALHNHPASEPHYYDYSRPSQADEDVAREAASSLVPAGITLVAYVCERGRFHPHLVKVADTLYPLSQLARQLALENTGDWWRNARLRLEAVRG